MMGVLRIHFQQKGTPYTTGCRVRSNRPSERTGHQLLLRQSFDGLTRNIVLSDMEKVKRSNIGVLVSVRRI
jgi:hypothetical protein